MRIVSLCPSITETLIDFGLAASLVGITRYCIHPREITRGLPRVGGTKDPDLEAIRRARPELVFVNEEENTRAVYEALAREFRVEVSFPRRVREVPGVLRRFGELTGTSAIAESRARELERALAAGAGSNAGQAGVQTWSCTTPEMALAAGAGSNADDEAAVGLESHEVAAGSPHTAIQSTNVASATGAGADGQTQSTSEAMRFVYLIWRDPWMTVSGDTYVSDLFTWAGGQNIYAGASERYPTITLDALAAKSPNLILLPDEPFRFRARDKAELAPLFPAARIELISGDDACWHGVRSLRGIALARLLFTARTSRA